jgi:hypothetical protein
MPHVLRAGANALREFPFTQLDFDVRRQFSITERMKLQWQADFFNLLNHPNSAPSTARWDFLVRRWNPTPGSESLSRNRGARVRSSYPCGSASDVAIAKGRSLSIAR